MQKLGSVSESALDGSGIGNFVGLRVGRILGSGEGLREEGSAEGAELEGTNEEGWKDGCKVG